MDEITNILNGDVPEEANNLSEPAKKKESFKEGAKCKRNTAISGIVDKINKGVNYLDNFLFKNFDKYLSIGVGAIYDTIEGKTKIEGFKINKKKPKAISKAEKKIANLRQSAKPTSTQSTKPTSKPSASSKIELLT